MLLLFSSFFWSDFWSAFYKLSPINRSAFRLISSHSQVSTNSLGLPQIPSLSFLSPIFCWLLYVSSSGGCLRCDLRGAEMTMKLKLAIMLCSRSTERHQATAVAAAKVKYKLTLKKHFCLKFFFFFRSPSMRKQFETKRNKKWFPSKLSKTDFLTFFSFSFFLLFEMDDWHISRILCTGRNGKTIKRLFESQSQQKKQIYGRRMHWMSERVSARQSDDLFNFGHSQVQIMVICLIINSRC